MGCKDILLKQRVAALAALAVCFSICWFYVYLLQKEDSEGKNFRYNPIHHFRNRKYYIDDDAVLLKVLMILNPRMIRKIH